MHFSSATPEWPTPQDLFDALTWAYGGFTLDPCATAQNAKCERFFTREDDGLAQPWTGKVFVNPPYGRGNRPMGEKGVGRISQWRARGLPAARPRRYALVARLCEARPRAFPARPPQVWFGAQQRSVSFRDCDFRTILHAVRTRLPMNPIHKIREMCDPACGSPR